MDNLIKSKLPLLNLQLLKFNMAFEIITKECEVMQEFIESECGDDPDALIGRLATLNVYLARSGKLLSDVKKMKDEQVLKIFVENGDWLGSAPATTAKQFINAKLSDVNYLINWLDRINRSIVHIGDNMRTQLSSLKEELKHTKHGYNT